MRERLAIAFLALGAASCTVHNLSWRQALRDYDNLVAVEGTAEERRVNYRAEASVSSWYERMSWAWLFPPLFGLLFGDETGVEPQPQAATEARARMAVLQDKAGHDVRRSAQLLLRAVPVLEVGSSPLSRCVALDAVESLADAYGWDLLEGVADATKQPTLPSGYAEIVETLRAHRPISRQGELAGEVRAAYLGALQRITMLPLPRAEQRHALVSDLTEALTNETDAELEVATVAAWQRAAQHCARALLARAMVAPESEMLPLRLRALEVAHRNGGVDSIPLLLAMISVPPELTAGQKINIDPDPYVRLRMIHLCGQLDRQRAEKVVRLPYHQGWEPYSPLQFLCLQVLDEEAFITSLRIPAQEALCRCLGKPVDYDLAWVRELLASLRRSS